MKKYLTKEQKKLIIKRYLDGESITNLTREFWPNYKVNNYRHSIYNWILKYASQEEIDQRKKVKPRIKKEKIFYSYDLKYNAIMRYLTGESSLKIAKDIWPDIDPYQRTSFIRNWKKDFENKGIIKRNLKRKKKEIHWEKFTKEELIEILKIYDQYNKILNDDKKKQKKFKIIKIQSFQFRNYV